MESEQLLLLLREANGRRRPASPSASDLGECATVNAEQVFSRSRHGRPTLAVALVLRKRPKRARQSRQSGQSKQSKQQANARARTQARRVGQSREINGNARDPRLICATTSHLLRKEPKQSGLRNWPDSEFQSRLRIAGNAAIRNNIGRRAANAKQRVKSAEPPGR